MNNRERELEKKEESIIAYKGFDSNMQCRGYQYEIGKEYIHDGPVKACEGGFHACEYPMDVFNYYAPAGNKFAIVKQSGVLSRHEDDTKVASKKIFIEAAIDIAGLVKAAIKYTMDRCDPINPESPASATGYQGAASATGTRGAASATGRNSVAMSSGWNGMAKGMVGCALLLVRRNDDGEIIHAKGAIVGKDGVKPETWYALNDKGEFIEV